ncbi:MAG: zinc-dependent alcohol dehydrogenase family protein [Candidatus Nanohaloarchaea archaeon]|nr:zinc-dependent alcohol dehydrogenase family protein [Candidatus Nanohaloarchaea archaeon]
MRAARFHGPGDIRIDDVPKPSLESAKGALIRVTHTAICGSDLWTYNGERDTEEGARLGHEPMGIVEEVGEDVRSVEPGDRVFAPFSISCGRCEFCRRGLHTSCRNVQWWGDENGGAQGEYIKTPYADGTLVRIPDRYSDDEAMLKSLLPLTDVMGTGHHAAVSAEVGAGDTCVVIGDGAVGLCGVLAARRLGARSIIAIGHHEDRLDIASDFGATHTIPGNEVDAAERVSELVDGGVEHVMECVGAASSMEDAVEICRPGGTIGYVGVPIGIDEQGMELQPLFSDNITLRGGVAPVRAYADELMQDVLNGTLDPSPIFTMETDLDGVPDGYEAMNSREAIKVLVRP